MKNFINKIKKTLKELYHEMDYAFDLLIVMIVMLLVIVLDVVGYLGYALVCYFAEKEFTGTMDSINFSIIFSIFCTFLFLAENKKNQKIYKILYPVSALILSMGGIISSVSEISDFVPIIIILFVFFIFNLTIKKRIRVRVTINMLLSFIISLLLSNINTAFDVFFVVITIAIFICIYFKRIAKHFNENNDTESDLMDTGVKYPVIKTCYYFVLVQTLIQLGGLCFVLGYVNDYRTKIITFLLVLFGNIYINIAVYKLLSETFSSKMKDIVEIVDLLRFSTFDAYDKAISIEYTTDNEIKRILDSLKESTKVLCTQKENLTESLENTIFNKDDVTGFHCHRTQEYMKYLIEGIRELDSLPENGDYDKLKDDAYCKCLINLSPLHDLGKRLTDEKILMKPDKLTDEEYEEMKKHTENGRKISEYLREQLGYNKDNIFFVTMCELTQYHHEAWNGKGYNKLMGYDIPLSARLMALADSFDAATHTRPYTKNSPKTFEDITDDFNSKTRDRYDPVVLEAYNLKKDKFKKSLENEKRNNKNVCLAGN